MFVEAPTPGQSNSASSINCLQVEPWADLDNLNSRDNEESENKERQPVLEIPFALAPPSAVKSGQRPWFYSNS